VRGRGEGGGACAVSGDRAILPPTAWYPHKRHDHGDRCFGQVEGRRDAGPSSARVRREHRASKTVVRLRERLVGGDPSREGRLPDHSGPVLWGWPAKIRGRLGMPIGGAIVGSGQGRQGEVWSAGHRTQLISSEPSEKPSDVERRQLMSDRLGMRAGRGGPETIDACQKPGTEEERVREGSRRPSHRRAERACMLSCAPQRAIGMAKHLRKGTVEIAGWVGQQRRVSPRTIGRHPFPLPARGRLIRMRGGARSGRNDPIDSARRQLHRVACTALSCHHPSLRAAAAWLGPSGLSRPICLARHACRPPPIQPCTPLRILASSIRMGYPEADHPPAVQSRSLGAAIGCDRRPRERAVRSGLRLSPHSSPPPLRDSRFQRGLAVLLRT
jgi:hypothetical protein